jgi:exopolysaccharide biosynthesis polyprenyl glycosylphosphotransferase
MTNGRQLSKAFDRDAGTERGRSGHRGSFAWRALTVDVIMLSAGVATVAALSPTSSPTGQVPSEPIEWLVAYCVLVVLVFRLRGMYTAPLRLELTEALREIVSATAIAAVLAMAGRVLITNEAYVAAETVRHWLATVPLLTAGRAALLVNEARRRRVGAAGRRTLVVGAGDVGRLTARRLLAEPALGLVPVGFLDDDPVDGDDEAADLRVYPWDDFEVLVRQERLEHVIIAFSGADDPRLIQLTRRAWELGLAVSVVPRLFELEGRRAETVHLGGLPLVALSPADPQIWQFRLKYALDRVVAAVLLCVAMPVLLAAMGAVWLTLGRPLLFRQRRIGRDGTTFDMLKLRTLREAPAGYEADAAWAANELGGETVAAYAPLEARMGRVTRFLRRSAIDELPQLWNVVRGDMSLVGPRPERVPYAARFGDRIYRYSDRHRVKSGLTGLAQVNGLRGKTSLRDRVEWDNHYIENWSPWLDLKILLKTTPALLAAREVEAENGAPDEAGLALGEGELALGEGEPGP